MAHRETMTTLEVCNNAYEWKERDFESAKGPDSEDEVEGYIDLVNDQRCSPPIYERIFSQRHSRKAVEEKKAVTSQPSRDRNIKERNQHGNHHDNKHKTSRSTEMPSSHLVLAVSSLFICIFCWPAAPCAILATIYGIQVGHHWKVGHRHEARSASAKAKELATTALVCGGINAVICFVLTLTSILIALGMTGYLSKRVPVHAQ